MPGWEDEAVQETLAGPGRGIRSRWLKVGLIVAPGIAFLALVTAAVLNLEAAPAVGDPAPGFEGELLEGGGTLGLADLEGKPAVLNFWASWCGPCKDEAPMLREAHRRYGDRIAFVGIDIKDARSDAIEFTERYRIDYPHVRDADLTIYDRFGLTGQPETFFLDENGVILEHVPGPLFRETLFQLLDSLIARST